MRMNLKYLALGLVASMFVCGDALAATSANVPIDVAFDTALSVTKDTNINFGVIADVTAGTYVISTAGAVVASNGGQVINDSTAEAGQVTVVGSATQHFTIEASAYNADGGATPSALMCKIGAGAETSCDTGSPLESAAGPGVGVAVSLGVTLTTTDLATDGDAPTVDVTVVYA
ncbi:MAG: DUF4402 domain-containing protein [Alphaproteobacteria bacterium]|nr:DUF4402 domain-containing protein [Alphaproteobacteria bacterium]